jgi:hypothetical protein
MSAAKNGMANNFFWFMFPANKNPAALGRAHRCSGIIIYFNGKSMFAEAIKPTNRGR